MEWIDINKQRPEEGQMVVVLRQYDSYMNGELVEQELKSPLVIRGIGEALDDRRIGRPECHIISRVAYWLPLPEFNELPLHEAMEE